MIPKILSFSKNHEGPESITLLIIDDDIEIQQALRDLLSLENETFLIYTAGNINDAKSLIKAKSPDIILIDIKLGNDNGLELLHEIKRKHKDTTCIMMTAYRDPQYTISAIRLGADDYLHKPIRPETLISTITRNIEKHRLIQTKNESDLRFMAAFEQTFQHIYLLDTHGRILDINQTALNFIQLDKNTVLNSYATELPYWSSSDAQKSLINTFIKNRSSASLHTDIKCVINNSTLFFGISLKCITNERRSNNLIILELSDITRQKTAEIRIQQANQELESRVKERTLDLEQSISLLQNEINTRRQTEQQLKLERNRAESANKAKNEFLSRMSHELRTPMNAILGFSQLLKMPHETPLTPGQEGHINEIILAGNHLLGLINQILNFSKVESGHFDLRPESVDMINLIEQCRSQLQNSLDELNIQFINKLDTTQGLYVIADYNQLKQVVLNLLSNAIHYNKPDGIITIDSEDINNSRLRFFITDTGIGINPDHQHRLFEPFDRLDNDFISTGTGIGLPLTKRLLELMNGDIGYNSEQDRGSTFWFELEKSQQDKV